MWGSWYSIRRCPTKRNTLVREPSVANWLRAACELFVNGSRCRHGIVRHLNGAIATTTVVVSLDRLRSVTCSINRQAFKRLGDDLRIRNDYACLIIDAGLPEVAWRRVDFDFSTRLADRRGRREHTRSLAAARESDRRGRAARSPRVPACPGPEGVRPRARRVRRAPNPRYEDG